MYQADFYRKNNTCISCVFNGFKYTNLFGTVEVSAEINTSIFKAVKKCIRLQNGLQIDDTAVTFKFPGHWH